MLSDLLDLGMNSNLCIWRKSKTKASDALNSTTYFFLSLSLFNGTLDWFFEGIVRLVVGGW